MGGRFWRAGRQDDSLGNQRLRRRDGDQIRRLIEDYVLAARRARQCGFDFVDIKHCHGYLGHEFLSAHTRPGPYGGSLENRTRC